MLRSARRYPEDVERSDVVGVLRVEDASTRAEALLSAVALAPDGADVDREIAEWLATVDDAAARRFVEELLKLEPARVRPDLLNASRRVLVAEVGAEESDALARSAAALAEDLRDADAVTGVIDMLDQLDARHGISIDVYVEVAGTLLRRADDDARWRAAFDEWLYEPGAAQGFLGGPSLAVGAGPDPRVPRRSSGEAPRRTQAKAPRICSNESRN